MKFLEIINNKKFIIISIFLFLYVILNLLDGERGLISYYENQNTKKHLIKEKKFLVAQLKSIEEKNDLIKGTVDLDYLEILYRKKFMVGKSDEKIYNIDN